MHARLTCLFAILLATGCVASVPMAPHTTDAAAQLFQAPPDRANLYVYRSELMGGAFPMNVLLDGEQLGQNAPSTYLHTLLTPGQHSVTSKTTENVSGVVIDAQPGRNYFLWQEAKVGVFSVRTLLQSVDEETGRQEVSRCKMAVTNSVSPRPVAPQSEAVGCGKDTDCKGDRICLNGECVDPSPPPVEAPARSIGPRNGA